MVSFFRDRVDVAECGRQVSLASYAPALALEGLVTGIDNLRHDVFLSSKLVQQSRTHIARLIAKSGNVEDLVAEDPLALAAVRRDSFIAPPPRLTDAKTPEAPADFKAMIAALQTATLNRAKAEGNLALDLLARAALVKFLRVELTAQFAVVLERCRARLRKFEGPRQPNPAKGIELRERTAAFQLAKKPLLRKVGQDLFHTLRDIEKETIARMRRSLFGEASEASYELFLNRLLFTEDGRDDFLNAEHYVMLGNFERDPDRFHIMCEIAAQFLKSAGVAADSNDRDAALDAILSAPENALELLAGGSPEDSGPKGKVQKALLAAWVDTLEHHNVMDHVVASYETVPLLAAYSPPINPQQLKNALISRTERKRVETLLEEHGKLSADNLEAAVKRVARCGGGERAKVAGRFFQDLLRYHRDLRRFEAVMGALDSINLIGNERLRELSAINHTLYEFLLPEEQKPITEKVVHHVVLKADIRDSTSLTRTLYERGLNPASYFSLNFYEPINKLLPKYAATKLFIEGDALIVALFEREGESGFGVGRACVLAKEIIEIVRGYNEQSHKSGLPTLELGVGISYQDTAPMYLMDGDRQIMISPALNASDRLSSCSKSARKFCEGVQGLFNVYSFQTVDDADTAGQPDEFLIRYNIGGITMDEAAFTKLQQEISLEAQDLPLPTLWGEGNVRLYTGVVPVATGIFHKVIVREARVPHIDAREFQLKDWTERRYYEICTNSEISDFLEHTKSSAATT